MKKVSKIVIYGDSISTINHGNGGYEGALREAYGAEIVNYAVGSSGLAYTTPNNTAQILENPEHIPGDADVILLWHGTNDWYWGSPVGRLGDTEPDTFYGAVNKAVSSIRRCAPEAVLVWITPIYRFEKGDGVPEAGRAYETKNKAGNTMEAYYQAIMQASVRYGFPVIDMRRLCGIHEGNQELYLEDQVHPNQAGYERISRVLKRGLDALLYDSGYEI